MSSSLLPAPRPEVRADLPERWQRVLGAPRAHLWLALCALMLYAPALGAGMLLDDHVLQVLAHDPHGLAGHGVSPLFLFTFTDGLAADNHALMDKGALLPWYGDPLHRNAFFRPLASLTHLFDFAVAPTAAWFMHLHSLLWFALLLFVVAHVYRSLASSGPTFAMLAFALFALDDAHAMTVTWIANRNALISAGLALPALALHDRWLAHGVRRGAWLGPLCFALGLCAGESAVAVFGYVLAYAVVLDRSPLAERALHVLPYLALLALWRVLFGVLGLGSFGSGAYHEPVHEPIGYALGLLRHLPVLLSAQLALPLADNWFWGPAADQPGIWKLSLVCTFGFALLTHLLLKRDREARFWMLGMVLSACAVAASVPGERLLLVPGVGGAALMASLLSALYPHTRAARVLVRVGAQLLFVSLALLHLVVAPLSLPVRTLAMSVVRSALERADASIPSTPDIRERTVIVLNAPFDVMCSYLQPRRHANAVPQPAHVYWLATASSPLRLDVLDEHTLSMRPERGFLLSEPERHYRGDPSALRPGTHVQLSEMDAEILDSTPDQRPASARFRFREPLRSPRYLFVRYADGVFVPWQPEPHASQLFAASDFFQVIGLEALRLLHSP